MTATEFWMASAAHGMAVEVDGAPTPCPYTPSMRSAPQSFPAVWCRGTVGQGGGKGMLLEEARSAKEQPTKPRSPLWGIRIRPNQDD